MTSVFENFCSSVFVRVCTYEGLFTTSNPVALFKSWHSKKTIYRGGSCVLWDVSMVIPESRSKQPFKAQFPLVFSLTSGYSEVSHPGPFVSPSSWWLLSIYLFLTRKAEMSDLSSQSVFSMRRRHRGSHLGLMLLASQVFQMGLDNIPPVTLAVLGLNVYLYLFPAAPLMQAMHKYWYSILHNYLLPTYLVWVLTAFLLLFLIAVNSSWWCK